LLWQGTNGRWQGVLTPAQLAKYDEVVTQKLTPECAAWLAHGKSALQG
jgi:aryl sulfotransferase